MRERAIVSEIPGTTRDTIEEFMEIGGIPIRLVDTAGMRVGGGRIEQLGVQRSLQVMEQADLVLAVFDMARPWSAADAKLVGRLLPERTIVVGSKCDLDGGMTLDLMMARVEKVSGCGNWANCRVSSVTGEGLDELRELITGLVAGDSGMHLEEPVLATERQRSLVRQANEAVGAALDGARTHRGEELICEDIRTGARCLGQMTGEDLTADLLDELFSRFCLGK
jgi:tRNA modification GTPase